MAETVRSGGMCRALDEQWEVPIPAEEKFYRTGQTPGLFMGPMAFLSMHSVPLPWALDRQILAVSPSFTGVDGLSEAMPIPAMAILVLTMCVAFGIGGLLTPIGAMANQTSIEFVEQETNAFTTSSGWIITAGPIVQITFAALYTMRIPPNRLAGRA